MNLRSDFALGVVIVLMGPKDLPPFQFENDLVNDEIDSEGREKENRNKAKQNNLSTGRKSHS
jgi:hypothetical protein